MSFLKSKHQIKRCPKTGRVIPSTRKHRWLWWLFPFMGLAALVWFLVRVIPKPSRATYPCQRVAFPLASGFIIWLLGIIGSTIAYRKAKSALARARYVTAAVCIAVSVGFIWAAMSSTGQKPVYAHDPIVANSPLGEGKGVYPGRVVWIHDPDATDWDGPGDGYWWESDHTSQPVVDEMLSKALRALTGENNDYDAWDAIFRNFNQQMGNGDVGYTPGEKIAIKINMTLTHNSDPSNMIKSPGYIDNIDNSPQLAIALLKQLTDVLGANPGDISIGDPGRIMPNYWYNMVEPNCPGVVYIARYGGMGRTQSQWSSVEFYWSDPDPSHWTGVTEQDYIPVSFAEADYFINFPILKSHDASGITVGGKNHYGSLIRNPNTSGYYDMHWTRVNETPGMEHYRAIVDLMGHPRLGGKTILAIIDGLYAGENWDSVPAKWQMAPFNDDWPSSIFLSMDQVAADSVAFDFLYEEWDDYPHMSGADDYLHEAALIPDPCSGTNYDPNDDGGLTESLGVHEHWNNATDKQYSRNLDPVNGTGIQLVTGLYTMGDFEPDGDVDSEDFAVLAAAWRSQPGDGNWNASCDISMSSGNIIDEYDLIVFCESWLN